MAIHASKLRQNAFHASKAVRLSTTPSCSHRKQPRKDALHEGRSAWISYLSERPKANIALLVNGSTPDPQLDLDAPWWCMALTTTPCFLSTEERSDCEMIMGFVRKGDPPLDWHLISHRATEIFLQYARAAGSSSRLHLDFFGHDDQLSNLRCSGRCMVVTPSYQFTGFFEDWGTECALFDRLRVKRRRFKAVPSDWSSRFGDSRSKLLWGCGMSSKAFSLHLFDDWLHSIRALMQAMSELGGARVELVPGFFDALPWAIDDDKIKIIDAERCDPLRSRWDIEAQCLPAPPCPPSKRLHL